MYVSKKFVILLIRSVSVCLFGFPIFTRKVLGGYGDRYPRDHQCFPLVTGANIMAVGTVRSSEVDDEEDNLGTSAEDGGLYEREVRKIIREIARGPKQTRIEYHCLFC